MKLEPAICYEALKSHDKRFDGKFFVAVRTTGIYCRNVCRVKLPKPSSCTFYINAAQAEKAGYRPCLKCRPELAPGSSPADSVSRLAFIIASRIEEGGLEADDLGDMASKLGISSRHLRRVIEAEYGVSPIELVQTQRLLLAKRLLTDTSMSVTEIAMASGFNSIRRFNALFQERYRLKPSDLRKNGQNKIQNNRKNRNDHLVCYLRYQSPFDWQALLHFLKQRGCAGVEAVRLDEGKYLRTVCIGNHQGWLQVENVEDEDQVKVTMSLSLVPVMPKIIARVKRLFDLAAPIKDIELSLKKLVKHKGMRVPGAFDGFELLIRVILGQQVSVAAATTLSGRLAAKYSRSIETPFAELKYLPLDPRIIASAKLEDMTALGIVRARAELIQKIALMAVIGELVLEPCVDHETILVKLKQIKGVGDWTAQVVAMRALSHPDAFPEDDLGIKKALGINNKKELRALAQKWSPWRSYACIHLWKSLEIKK